MKNPTKRLIVFWNNRKHGLADVSLAWFPALISFFYIPTSLFLANQDDFDHNLIILVPFIYLLVLSFAILLPLLFFNEKTRGRIAVFLFFCGIFIAMSDATASWKFVPLTGFSKGISADRIFIIICWEFFLALILSILAIKLPTERIRDLGTPFVWLLFFAQIIFFGFSQADKSHLGESDFVLAPEQQMRAEKGNVYHIVVDSYHRELFLRALKRTNLSDHFDSFVFFKNNRSNYLFTAPSYASYMTGSLYQDGSLKKWKARADNDGLLKNFYDAGYNIWQYAVKNSWQHQAASHFTTIEKVTGHEMVKNNTLTFFDLSLRRIVPLALQPASMKEGKSLVADLWGLPPTLRKMDSMQWRSVISMVLFEQCIAEEPSRPATGQYVYLHPYLPHPPYVFDENCSFSLDSTLDEQTTCVTKVVSKFFDTLKDLGRYDQSTIILQSDHGSGIKAIKPSSSELSEEVAIQINEVKLWDESIAVIDNLSRSLLAVKPPHRSGENLAISSRLTQLLDIPATIYSLTSVDGSFGEGMSVFADDFPADREVDIFVGYIQESRFGNKKTFGKDLFRGEMNNLSFSLSRGWDVKPNVSVTWDQ